MSSVFYWAHFFLIQFNFFIVVISYVLFYDL